MNYIIDLTSDKEEENLSALPGPGLDDGERLSVTIDLTSVVGDLVLW